jgi:hypothetical protein
MKQPWVFWFRINIRKNWFSYWYKTRGSNYIEFQIWIIKISIGLPWSENVKKYFLDQYGNLKLLDRVNQNNLKSPLTLLIN